MRSSTLGSFVCSSAQITCTEESTSPVRERARALSPSCQCVLTDARRSLMVRKSRSSVRTISASARERAHVGHQSFSRTNSSNIDRLGVKTVTALGLKTGEPSEVMGRARKQTSKQMGAGRASSLQVIQVRHSQRARGAKYNAQQLMSSLGESQPCVRQQARR